MNALDLSTIIVAALTATSTLLAFTLTLTRSARQRQQERVLREACSATSSPAQSAALESLRQVIVADMVARQLVPGRRYLITALYHVLVMLLVTLTSYAIATHLGGGDAWMGQEFFASFRSAAAGYLTLILGGLVISTFLTATLWGLQEHRARIRLAYVEGSTPLHGRRAGDKITKTRAAWIAGGSLALATALTGAFWGYFMWAVQGNVTPSSDVVPLIMSGVGVVGLLLSSSSWPH